MRSSSYPSWPWWTRRHRRPTRNRAPRPLHCLPWPVFRIRPALDFGGRANCPNPAAVSAPSGCNHLRWNFQNSVSAQHSGEGGGGALWISYHAGGDVWLKRQQRGAGEEAPGWRGRPAMWKMAGFRNYRALQDQRLGLAALQRSNSTSHYFLHSIESINQFIQIDYENEWIAIPRVNLSIW